VTVGAVCGGWSCGFGLDVGQLGIRGISKTTGGEECVQQEIGEGEERLQPLLSWSGLKKALVPMLLLPGFLEECCGQNLGD
jgi:hypothetical protein